MNQELQDDHSDKCFCNKNKSASRRRRLIVAFDGTQNQFGPESSHVVEFYSRIVKSGDQLSYYTSGIGTFVTPSSHLRGFRMWTKNKWEAIVAPNFQANLLSGYRFLSDKYEMGDQIFLLGFSRGAYQARVLAAMIAKVGLLRTGNNEQIPFAFKTYLDPTASNEIWIDRVPGRSYRGTTTTAKEFRKAFCHDVNIHFVGVWDTVSSVGLLRNKYYPRAEVAENICFFRHALALDERRVKFLPEYVVAKKECFSAGNFGPPRCKEVWFRGFHSDIGGGNVKNRTSDNGAIPSRWMAYEAMLAGLEMTPFWDGIKERDLVPSTGKNSMTPFYKFLEYFIPFKWEDHSKESPILTGEKPSPRHFSQSPHRERPRQIFDHQKLHSSVCLHKEGENPLQDPLASLPDSWINNSERRNDWTAVIEFLRDKVETKDEVADASKIGMTDLHPLKISSKPSPNRQPSIAPVDRSRLGFDLPGAIEELPTIASDERGPIRNALGTRVDNRVANPRSGDEIRQGNREGAPGTRPSTHEVPPAATVVRPENFSPLPNEVIELDLLDCDGIPALIVGVLRGKNVAEFLGRLKVLAYTEKGKMSFQQDNSRQFSSMLQQLCNNKSPEYTGLAIQVAYEVFWHSDVYLYDSDKKLWEAIFSRVEKWNELQTSLTDGPWVSACLQRAGRLLHKIKSEDAFVEIEHAIAKMFVQWQGPPASAPPQLRFLLATAAECRSRKHILRLAVFSSPHFLDPAFTKILLDRLAEIIRSGAGGRGMGDLAMLYCCILCAIDQNVTLSEESFNSLRLMFERRGSPMKELWEMVMPEASNMLREFCGKPETITKLRDGLSRLRFTGVDGHHLSWAADALDQALNPPTPLRPPIPEKWSHSSKARSKRPERAGGIN